ncbi:MAG: DUF721 domain-containing protein [Alphaproteobacteria bacterium]|jgi:hypothetical protein|nr:DUF721 domain-containing protein [Alphaproteobacteria bacterium]MBT7942403.1 DUF721 domain-containing protein [Alphaproteobacteria bacterium]
MATGTTKQRKRGGGPRALATSLGGITKNIFGQRGLADGAILKDWAQIAGAQMAAHSQPEKISYPQGAGDGGTLHLRIDSGAMATELQHLQPLLIERINGYFGFKAVDRVKITQGPLPDRDEKRPWSPRKLEDGEEHGLAESLMDVDDEDIREALQALGRAVIGRSQD